MKTMKQALVFALASGFLIAGGVPALAGGTISTLKGGGNLGQNILQQGDNVLKQGDNLLKQGDNIFKQGDNVFKQGDNIFKQGDNVLKQGDDVANQGGNLLNHQKLPARPLPDPKKLNPDDWAEAADEFEDAWKGIELPNHPPGYQIVTPQDFANPAVAKAADNADDLPPLQKFKNSYEQPDDAFGAPPKSKSTAMQDAYKEAMDQIDNAVPLKPSKVGKVELPQPKFVKNSGNIDSGLKNAGQAADNGIRKVANAADDFDGWLARRPKEIADEVAKKKPGFIKQFAKKHPVVTTVGVVSVAGIVGVGGWLAYDLGIKPAVADAQKKEDADDEAAMEEPVAMEGETGEPTEAQN